MFRNCSRNRVVKRFWTTLDPSHKKLWRTPVKAIEVNGLGCWKHSRCVDKPDNVDAMAYWLRHWIPNPGVQCLKPLGDLKVDSAFHPFKVDQMSTKNFWEPSSKK